MISPERNSRRTEAGRYLCVYTAVFAAVCLLVFCTLIAQGKTLIWEGDGMKQHLRALTFMGMWVRSAFESLATGGGFSLPTFSFAMGYGQDIISNMSYYAIGDPLNLSTVFVPEKHTYLLFNALAVLRMYLAGLAFSLYCWQMKLGKGPAILAGAISYAFCLFALCAVVRHPFFLNAMVYLPLVLLGVERIIFQRKPGLFVGAIAVSALSNFYFFYMIFLLLALYIIWRLATINGKDIRASLHDFAMLLASGTIGVLIACVIFLPSALAVLSDTRAASDTAISLFYGLDYYKAFLFGFTSTIDPGEWSFCGYGIIALMAVFLLFSQKGRMPLKVAFLVLTAMLLLPIAGLAMNGFSYTSNRWIWGYSMLIACILVVCWEDIRSLKARQAGALAICCLAYVTLSAYCGSAILGTMQALALCAFQAAIGIFAIAISRLNDKNPRRFARKADAALIALLIAGITANSLCLLASFAGDYSGKLLTWDYASNLLQSEAKITADYAAAAEDGSTPQSDDSNRTGDNAVGEGENALSSDNDEAPASDTAASDGFWRYSGSYWILMPNSGLTANAPSTDYYWSLSNKYVAQFMNELGVNTQEYESNRYRNLDERTMLEEVARVRYHLALEDETIPYGFTLSRQEATEDGRSWKIFENEHPLPFAYACETLTTPDEYESMGMAQRQQAMMQSIVVDSEIQGIDHLQLDDESSSIPFTVTVSENVMDNGDGTFTAEEAGCIFLEFEGLAQSETYLEIKDLGCSTPRSKMGFSIDFLAEDGSSTTRKMKYATSGYHGTSGRTDYLINSGYSDGSFSKIAIHLPVEGSYQMDLGVICQEFNSYESNAAKLAGNGEENLQLNYPANTLAASNEVSFDISAENRSVVTTAIPYSQGWSVTVDGKPAELVRTNTMYTGVVIEEGTHHIVMAYETPGLKLGAIASAAGLVLLIALNLLLRRNRASAMPSRQDGR